MFIPNPKIAKVRWRCFGPDDRKYVSCFSQQHACEIRIHRDDLSDFIIIGSADEPYENSCIDWILVKAVDKDNCLPFFAPADSFVPDRVEFLETDSLIISNTLLYYYNDEFNYPEIGKMDYSDSFDSITLYSNIEGISYEDANITQVIPTDELEIIKGYLLSAGYKVTVGQE